MWRLKTFGGLTIEPADGAAALTARRRPLALLALLAAAGDRGCGREKIAALLWPESDEMHGRNSLNQAVTALRRDMSSPDPVVGGSELRLNPSAITSDLAQFEGSIASGAFEHAAELCQGPFLDGFFLRDASDFERWAAAQRRRLHEMHLAALERLARAADERREYDLAVIWWRKLAALDPTSAPAACGLIRVLSAMGDRAGAVRQYREHEDAVRHEFGVAPDAAVRALADSLRRERTDPPRARTTFANSERNRLSIDRSLAVMPLANLSDDKANDYLGEGLAGEMTNALARAGLRVIGPGSTRTLAARDLDACSIARQLGVANVLTGTVQRDADRLRITMSLVSAADGALVWGEKYDRELRDIFALQDDIAHNVASGLRVTLSGGPEMTLVRKETDDPDAHALYLQGLYQWNRRTAQTLHLAIDLFHRAIQHDSEYGRAHTGICLAYAVLPVYTDVPIDETRSRAVDAARRALAIDETLAEAHTVLGLTSAYVFENASAERAFETALRLDPNCATAHFWYAILLGHLGRHEDAIREVRVAHNLEPASLAIQSGLAEQLFYARRYEEADCVLRAVMALDSSFQLGLIIHSRVLIELGRFDEAVAILERLSREPSIRSAEKLGTLAYAYARADRPASARATLARVSRDPQLSASGEIAVALSVLGEHDAAVAMFRRAVAQHDQRMIAASRSEPYDRLRRDRQAAPLFEEMEAPS